MKKTRITKTKRFEKLSQKEQASLVYDLIHALIQTQSVSDAALFLQDLLTKSELRLLGKRLRIAKLLLSGTDYREIEQRVHVSHSTIAKIAAWLSERGDGFRKIVKRLPAEKKEKTWEEYSEWDRIKRKYPLYFWPELLLEEVVKAANKKEKERIKNVLERLDEKSELHKRIATLLRG